MIRASALFGILLSASALAATPATADNRLVEVRYSEAQVYRVEGKPKVQATIRFGEDEAIENVAIGDSNAWQVTPNKRANLLFVKPMMARAVTNMTVVTNKHTYLFDLVASPTARPLYVMSFKYPEPPKPKVDPSAQLAASDAPAGAAPAKPAVPDTAQLNFAWSKAGAAKLLPHSVFDDGEAVFLSWPEGRPVPAILVADAEGTEGPVNFAVRGNTIVVDGVPAQLILRSGKERATIVNAGPPRPAAIPATTETTPRPPQALAQQEPR